MPSYGTRSRRRRIIALVCLHLLLVFPGEAFSGNVAAPLPAAFAASRHHAQVEQPRHGAHVPGSEKHRCKRLTTEQGHGQRMTSHESHETVHAGEANLRDRASFIKAGAMVLMAASNLPRAHAADGLVAPAETFVDFTDSRKLFSCRIPSKFLRKERAKDKRGTVFVAGDYNKAEVISVQVMTAYDLLADAGLPTLGGLTKWEDLGKPRLIAELLKQRRDADAAGGTPVESVVLPRVSIDGDVLRFTLRSQIQVMRTDLLEKDRGVSELYRNTLVKAIMRGDGSFLVIWAGALNTDWDQEGGAKNRLQEAVDSFRLEGLVVDGVRLGAL